MPITKGIDIRTRFREILAKMPVGLDFLRALRSARPVAILPGRMNATKIRHGVHITSVGVASIFNR